MDGELNSIAQLLDRIESAAKEGGQVSLGSVLSIIGTRSFGPLLLLAGLITLAPIIGDIPGVPTAIGVLVMLLSIQLPFGKEHLWLPAWLLNRSVASDKLCKAAHWSRRPARFIDRLLRPRLMFLTSGAAIYVVAGICFLIAAAMPVMEVVPFSANLAGAALTAFGLSLITRDGILALFAYLVTAGIVAVILYNLL